MIIFDYHLFFKEYVLNQWDFEQLYHLEGIWSTRCQLRYTTKPFKRVPGCSTSFTEREDYISWPKNLLDVAKNEVQGKGFYIRLWYDYKQKESYLSFISRHSKKKICVISSRKLQPWLKIMWMLIISILALSSRTILRSNGHGIDCVRRRMTG